MPSRVRACLTRKNNKRKWWKAPSRYRHSRGFGIHSPFAYGLLMNTLRDSSPYYVYEHINDTDRKHHRVLRLLVRLICHLRPVTFSARGPITDDAVRISQLVDSHIVIDATMPDMLLLGDNDANGYEAAIECVNAGGTVIVTDIKKTGGLAAAIISQMPHGMTFSNGETLIATGRHDLPRQHFELNFK